MTGRPRRTAPLRLGATPPELAVRRWTLRRWFTVGATLLGVLSLAAVVLGAWAIMRIGDARDTLFDEVAPAVTAGQDLNAALVDQETSVRGFTILANESFLVPYVDGQAAELRAADSLRGLTSSERLQGTDAVVAAVERTEARAAEWRRVYAEPTIAAARARVPGPDIEEGRRLFDQVRAASAELTDALQASRLVARAQLDNSITFVAVVGIAITIMAAVFIALAAVGLRFVILQPLRRLAGQTREVVDGDIGMQVLGSGPQEIVSLGADVDAMRAHIVREVDELQDTNARLDAQTRDLERSNRDLEQFAYVASHDLQEPLRKVSSFCQLLQRRYGGQLDERADQYIGFAVDGAQRMQRLINDLLAFSRVGRTTTGFVPVDLGAVGRAAAGQLTAAVEESGGEIVVPAGLPTVHGDPGLLTQLLFNLFGNGLKFHRDGVAPTVRLEGHREGDEWEIAVADNGIGIEPEFSDKIFVIFQRLHGRDVYAGTGIGLALAKKIVEFHGGRIWVDHTPSGEPGTVLRFTLPVTEPALPDPALPGIPTLKEPAR